MLIPFLFLLIFFCTTNAKNARARGQQPISWVLLTLFSVVIGVIIACFILGMIIMYKNPILLDYAKQNNRLEMNNFMLQHFAQHDFLYSSLIMAGGFGGYLLIRYFIEKKPLLQNS